MVVHPIKTSIFEERQPLMPFIVKHLKRVPECSVIVITSKIVALSEGRTSPSGTRADKIALIKKESDWAMETKYVWLTVKDNMVMASAGIDESNAAGRLVLLPKDSYKTAIDLRKKLMRVYKVKNLGILITDSRQMPLRAGSLGMAMGYAGFLGVKDYRGKKDLFGKKFVYSRSDIADSLATAAVLTMGEGNERQPLAVITDAPVVFTTKVNRQELEIDIREDLYQPLFAALTPRKGKIKQPPLAKRK